MKTKLKLATLFGLSDGEMQEYLRTVQYSFVEPPAFELIITFIKQQKLRDLPGCRELAYQMVTVGNNPGNLKNKRNAHMVFQLWKYAQYVIQNNFAG